MEKHFVTYEQALDLKDLGFKDSCFGEWRQWDGGYPWLQLYQDLDGCSTDDSDYQYTTEALAPLKSQVFEWFRKEHHLFGRVYPINVGGFANGEVPKDWQPEFLWEIYKPVGVRYYPKDNIVVKIEDNLYKSWYSYEEAESACIDKLIEISKSGL